MSDYRKQVPRDERSCSKTHDATNPWNKFSLACCLGP